MSTPVDSRRSNLLKMGACFALGVVATAAVPITLEAVHYLQRVHPELPPTAEGHPVSAVADPVHSSWVLEGAPDFQTTTFFKTSDNSISAGLWEATGPAKFEWHYDNDETVLVLEGGARITHEGQTRDVMPGAKVYFRAGEVVVWEVPERIKKSWVLHDPGRIARRLRPLADS